MQVSLLSFQSKNDTKIGCSLVIHYENNKFRDEMSITSFPALMVVESQQFAPSFNASIDFIKCHSIEGRHTYKPSPSTFFLQSNKLYTTFELSFLENPIVGNNNNFIP